MAGRRRFVPGARGWAYDEWRRHSTMAPRRFPGPGWDGGPVAGRTVLLVAEQGWADTIQLVRYAPLVKARGARVVVAAPGRLLGLLATCPGVDAAADLDGPAPPFDAQAPVLSLQCLLGTTPATTSAAGPLPVGRPGTGPPVGPPAGRTAGSGLTTC